MSGASGASAKRERKPEPETAAATPAESDAELAVEPDGENDATLDAENDADSGAAGHDVGGGAGSPESDGAGDADAANGDPFSLTTDDDFSGLQLLLSEDFARISAERDAYLDSLQRLKADFENFRKRTDRQQGELRDRANETLLARLLPVLDALDLALAHLGQSEAPTEGAAASLAQVNALLRDTLEREGLERIDSVGVPFDPNIHDATAIDESTQAGDDDAGEPEASVGPTVAEVWRAGYRLKDRVIRPAMVRVRG